MNRCCRDCGKKKYTVIDKNNNELEVEPIAFSWYDSKTDVKHIHLKVKDSISIFKTEDLRYLKFLLGEKLKYGGNTVTEMRKYAEIYEIIEKELEKNSLNQ